MVQNEGKGSVFGPRLGVGGGERCSVLGCYDSHHLYLSLSLLLRYDEKYLMLEIIQTCIKSMREKLDDRQTCFKTSSSLLFQKILQRKSKVENAERE